MFPHLLTIIQKENLSRVFFRSLVGIEIEEHRINSNGELSRYPYPTILGSRKYHPYLQSDFAESQNEIITAPKTNIKGALKQLNVLQIVLAHSLENDEYIWPLSMPPSLDKKTLNFISKNFKRIDYQKYRNYLIKKYSIPIKIICGIHINFSLPKNFLIPIFRHYQNKFKDFDDFKNQLYFHIAQNFILYRWIFTYLFGASPIVQKGFGKQTNEISFPIRSFRNSTHGYTNKKEDQLDTSIYSNLENYTKAISLAVKKHHLYSPAEFYGPVRLKGSGLLQNKKNKVEYLEFRTFDNDPFSLNGINKDELTFFQICLFYFLIKPIKSKALTKNLKKSSKDNNQTALENPYQLSFKINNGLNFFKDLLKVANSLSFGKQKLQIIKKYQNFIKKPKLTLAAKITKNIDKKGSLKTFGLKIAKKRKKIFLNSKNIFPSLSYLPFNIQKLIFYSIRFGINYSESRNKENKQVLKLVFNGKTKEVNINDFHEKNILSFLYKIFPNLKIIAFKNQW